MNKDISDFMLSEYDHVSNAHFETGKQISSFFRYYLIIVSAPAFVFVLINKENKEISAILKSMGFTNHQFTSGLFIFTGIIGYLIFIYLLNKKFNSVLYAQTVNGVRNYFKSNTSIERNVFLILPSDILKPKYFQLDFLISLVLSFSIINSIYIYLGMQLIQQSNINVLIGIVVLTIHLLTYTVWAKSKDNEHEKNFAPRA